ncbi:MAG: hypothetical protein AAF936_02690 [Pseudomonadota bacterium]
MAQNQTHRITNGDEREESQIRTATYIADLLKELKGIARKEEMKRLELVLEEAYDEALRMLPEK